MGNAQKPNFDLAKKVLPNGLLAAITDFFSENVPGAALVGGTALAGFYAGHRRSDDMDIFVEGPLSFRAAILAVQALEKMGLEIKNPFQSGHYYRAVAQYKKHSFTIDIVEDSNLFRVGEFHQSGPGIQVVSLKTLFKMKSATLVSRCSEKDLYDLIWLIRHEENPMDLSHLVVLGQEMDSGVSNEAILVSLGGAILREDACGFQLPKDPKDSKQIFQEIEGFRKNLIQTLHEHEKTLDKKNRPSILLKDLVRQIKRASPQ